MRKRHFRRGASKMSPIWERYSNSLATTAGSTAPIEILIAAPGLFEVVALDSNWTVRSIHLNLQYLYTSTIPVVDDSPIACLGLYKKDITNATVADASAPTTEDWLDLWEVQFTPSDGVAKAQGPIGMCDAAAQRRPRVMRKLNQDEGIFLTMTTFHFTIAQGAGFQGHFFLQGSQLWTRSLRK